MGVTSVLVSACGTDPGRSPICWKAACWMTDCWRGEVVRVDLLDLGESVSLVDLDLADDLVESELDFADPVDDFLDVPDAGRLSFRWTSEPDVDVSAAFRASLSRLTGSVSPLMALVTPMGELRLLRLRASLASSAASCKSSSC